MKSGILLIAITLSSITIQAQSLSDLEWMTGYWSSSENGTTMEELWSTSSGGMMLGLHRDVFGNGRSSFEYLRIVQSDNEILYLASPSGRPATPFTLKELSHQKVVFENIENDFPQRIIYSREGDKLTARIEDQSGDKGMQWTWTKTNFD
tara:strand:+ start:37036 stop:37485 length:450 start_codon:yes stop_codon:yes gene_type:complete